MCRDINHNGRRCPCDTSEARQLRRKNAAARSTYAELAIKPVEPKIDAAPVITKPYTVAKIQKDIESLTTLYREMKASGEVTPSKIAIAYNEKLDNIGSGIEYLAENKFGAPSDNDLKSSFEQAKLLAEEKAGAKKREAVSFHRKLEDEETELLNKLKEIASPEDYPIIRERRAVWEKTDPELYAAYQKKSNEVAEAFRNIHNSGAEARAELQAITKDLFEKRNAGFKAALEATGVKFADPNTIEVADDSHKGAVKSLKNALAFYPQAWVDASNKKHREKPLRIKNSKARAHYSSSIEQKGFSTSTVGFMVSKPADWVPDPHNRRDSEYIDLHGEETWTDPISGTKHSIYSDGDGEKAWMSISYTYHKGENPPKGKGWEKVELYEDKYVSGQGFVRSDTLTTHYRKPRTRRRQSSGKYTAEITINEEATTYVGDDAGMRVALHEFAHRVEHTTPVVTAYEDYFLKQRAGIYQKDGQNMEPEKLSVIYTGTKEVGFKDNFPNHYMGKVYDDSYREVLSMGMESIFAGTHGGLAGLGQYKADPGYKRFILGVLASSAATSKTA